MNTKRTTRRLSVLRVLAAGPILAGTFYAGTQVARQAMKANAESSVHWFAPYVDITLPPYYDFQDAAVNSNLDVVLAFVVASPTAPCTPSWGAAHDLDAASLDLDLDRRIARLRQRGGDVLVSFGGAANDELAHVCSDVTALTAAYKSVVDRYQLTAIDFDLEGESLDDVEALSRRATAIAALQAEAKGADQRLDVWLTLPVSPTGMSANAIAAVRSMLDAHVNLSGVNLMTMDYGDSRTGGASFVSASVAAVDAAAAQIVEVYAQVGIVLTTTEAHAKLGITPMIGQNDTPNDRLTVDDARALFEHMVQRGITRFSMWSLNRDAQCGGNIDPTQVSNLCSGVDQTSLEFSRIFGANSARPTDISSNPEARTQVQRDLAEKGSLPTPFPEWRPRREYDMGAKVVWNGQVYQAKWWNTQSQPDIPVEHDWDSPWRLLGPVMSQDASMPKPEVLPPGTYPEWDVETIYQPGDRVEMYGQGFRAKWWNRGEDPTADHDNEWESPWTPVGAPPG